MAVKIDKKIKGYAVVTPEDKAKAQAEPVSRAAAEAQLPTADVIQMLRFIMEVSCSIVRPQARAGPLKPA